MANERRRCRLFILLRREGEPSGVKRIHRLYREEGLSVRKRRARRKAVGNRAPILVEARPNARWSTDFVHDQFSNGQRLRIPNIVDDVTKQCLGAIADTSMSGRRVARELTAIIERHGKPGLIVSNNATVYTCHAMLACCRDNAIDLHFIAPGKPTDNAFIRRFQSECLNAHWFLSLADAREKMEDWLRYYNEDRPHGAIGHKPPISLQETGGAASQPP